MRRARKDTPDGLRQLGQRHTYRDTGVCDDGFELLLASAVCYSRSCDRIGRTAALGLQPSADVHPSVRHRTYQRPQRRTQPRDADRHRLLVHQYAVGHHLLLRHQERMWQPLDIGRVEHPLPHTDTAVCRSLRQLHVARNHLYIQRHFARIHPRHHRRMRQRDGDAHHHQPQHHRL